MGYSSASGFFCFFYMSRRSMVILILVFSVISMMCYPMAFHVCNEQRELKLKEDILLKGRKEQLEMLQNQRDRDVVIPTSDKKKYREVTLHHPKASMPSAGPHTKDLDSDSYFIDKVRNNIKKIESGNSNVPSHIGDSVSL